MEKSFLVFVLIVGGILYGIQYFVGDLDDKYMVSVKDDENKIAQGYISEDSVGQPILVFSKKTKLKKQLDVWHKSTIKLEFLAYFPNYEEMRFFIKDRTNGDLLQTHIMKAIDKVQSGYMKGKLNSTQAKQKLDKLD